MMPSSTHTQTGASWPRRQFTPNVVGLNLAKAPAGRTADFLVGAKNVTPGVVPGGLTEAGKPQTVVGRTSDDVRQMLTISPA